MAERFKVGEAPWEKETPTSFKAGEAPWEKKDVPQVEEMHPDVSWADRATVKNFAQSPEAGAAYLNQKGFETEIRDGNIYVRKPNERSFKALDPKGLDLQDVTDIAYDIPAGLLTGAATAASGIAGAAASGGVAALPAAAAGGAASSAGLEALRQKLGGFLGIPQEVSGRDVAVAGALGAASPLLFGTGATAAQAAKAGINQASQSGLVTRGVKAAFPSVARVTSGIPTEATSTYINRMPEVDDLIAQGPDAAANVAETTHKQVQDAFFAKKKEVGEALAKQVKGSPNLIGRDKLFEPLENRIQAMTNSELSMTPKGQAEIEALRQELISMKEGLPDMISPSTAWELQDQMKQMANFQNVKGTFQARYGANASGAEKALADAAGDSYRVINKELEQAAGAAGKKSEYSQLSRLQDKLQKYFKDPEATERTLLQLDAKSKGAARKTVKALDEVTGGTPVKDNAKLLEAYSYFQNPELLPMSTGGTTSTSRTLGLSSLFEAVGGLAGQKGAQVGRAAGAVAGGPKAVKAAIKAGKAASQLGAIPQRAAPLMTPWLNMELNKE